MSEIQLQRIRSVYGEIAGILSQLPMPDKRPWIYVSVGQHFNSAVNDLNELTDSDYTRQKLTGYDFYMNDRQCYDTVIARTKIGSVVKRLEEEYGFGAGAVVNQSAPVVVTVNQNQQVSLSVTPIQQIIDSTKNEEVRKELNELKQAVENGADQKTASKILSSLQAKSWEVFMKVLPFALEHWGHLPK